VVQSSFYQSFRLFESEALRNQYLLAFANRYREFSNFAKKTLFNFESGVKNPLKKTEHNP
jgi:hypothetical protein